MAVELQDLRGMAGLLLEAMRVRLRGFHGSNGIAVRGMFAKKLVITNNMMLFWERMDCS